MWTASFRKSTVVGWTTILVLWIVVGLKVDLCVGGTLPISAVLTAKERGYVDKGLKGFSSATVVITDDVKLGKDEMKALKTLNNGKPHSCVILSSFGRSENEKLTIFASKGFSIKMKLLPAVRKSIGSVYKEFPKRLKSFFASNSSEGEIPTMVKVIVPDGVDVSLTKPVKMICKIKTLLGKHTDYFFTKLEHIVGEADYEAVGHLDEHDLADETTAAKVRLRRRRDGRFVAKGDKQLTKEEEEKRLQRWSSGVKKFEDLDGSELWSHEHKDTEETAGYDKKHKARSPDEFGKSPMKAKEFQEKLRRENLERKQKIQNEMP